ncbi:Putative heterokaryon incompatibility protein [Podospora comata]|uniref:Heterokaryon incompatibility protein n=1 Tax=Podospora comata TaxID=48703 RepID=A0ABY6S6R7_PODCO|nr:Putative heterokaryon incompatibility protein [Podospora comata]
MAEVAGLVIGAISLASLFDSVVNNFDRVQVGREFGETYRRYLLQLEVLRLRLHRWRDAVSRLIELNDPAVKQANGVLVQRHLSDIQSLFEKEEKLSKPYYKVEVEDEAEGEEDWMVRTLRGLSRKHRANTPSVQCKVRWAIRGRNEFDRLVTNISVQVSNLEEIIPTHDMERRLSQMRSEDANEVGKQREANAIDIDILREIALIVDGKLSDMVKVKARNEWVGNTAEDESKLHQGDMVSNDYHGNAIAPGGLWKDNVAKGKSKVTQGTSYGFNPFA